MPRGILNLVSPEWMQHGHQHELEHELTILSPLLDRPCSSSKPKLLYPGSGLGGVFRWLTLCRMAVFGLDLDGNHCQHSAKLMPTVQANMMAMPYADNAFDVVFFDRALHHLITQGILETAVAEGARVLKPGGLLLAFEPNLWNPIGFAIESVRRLGFLQYFTGRDDDVPLSPTQMRQLFQRYGCSYRHIPGTFVWRRLPPAAQRLIVAAEPFLQRQFPSFARVLLFVGVKEHA